MNRERNYTICAGSSAGGHMSQLLTLLDCWQFPHKPDFYVTTMKSMGGSLAAHGKTYYVGECNRRHPLQAVGVLWRSLVLAIKKRPKVVVTTGSMPLALFCMWSKLLGAKIIWIDSITNVEKLSVSGRFVRYFADLMLVQWPDLADKYDNSEYAGALA